jgi:hypothetical protein
MNVKHRHLRAVLVSVTFALALSLSVASATAAPAQHREDSVVGDVFVCESATYTVIEGTLKFTFHEGSSKSGNTNFTGTLVPQNVVLVDEDGAKYRNMGALWFGDTSNAQQGSAQGTFTAHLNIVSQGGGVVDTIRQTGHFGSNGEFELDHGTCMLPE